MVVVVVVRARFDFFLLIISALVYLVVEIFFRVSSSFKMQNKCQSWEFLGVFFKESRWAIKLFCFFKFLVAFFVLFCFITSFVLIYSSRHRKVFFIS